MKMRILALAALLVSVVSASEGRVYATFDVEANQEATLALTQSGIVGAIKADVGDSVKAGDVLLVLENSQEKAAVAQASADYQAAKIGMEHARRVFARYTKIKDVIDKDQYEKYLYEKETAEANFQRAEAALHISKILLEKTYLKAPFDGTVSGRYVEVGDGVSGMQLTTLMDFISSGKRKMVLKFDAKHWKAVAVGDVFTYRVDGVEGEFKGEIAKIYPVSDKKSRNVKAEVYTEGLLPGLFGDGFIEVK